MCIRDRAYTIPNQEVTTVAKELVHNFCCRFVPLWKSIRTKGEISNQECLKNYAVYSEFERPGQRLCILSRTGRLRDSIGHLSSIFRRLLTRTKWTGTNVPLFLMAYRSSVHYTTGMTCLLYTSRCV